MEKLQELQPETEPEKKPEPVQGPPLRNKEIEELRESIDELKRVLAEEIAPIVASCAIFLEQLGAVANEITTNASNPFLNAGNDPVDTPAKIPPPRRVRRNPRRKKGRRKQ